MIEVGSVVTRKALLLSAALGLCLSAQARAQEAADPREAPATQSAPPAVNGGADLQDRGTAPPLPPPSTDALAANPDEVQFNANTLEYDYENDVVTANGDVRLHRRSDSPWGWRIVGFLGQLPLEV